MSSTSPPEGLNRRDFMRVALSTGGVALGATLAACSDDPHAGHASPTGPAEAKGGPRARNPLRIPDVVSPAGLTLVCQPGTAALGGGASTSAWMYNGQFPGPTLQIRRGSSAGIQLVNNLPQETITHWHGMLVDHENDGHPHSARPPGGSYAYAFAVDQRACLNWYHPHPHGRTGEQVYRGLAGAFIVRDGWDTGAAGNALGLPFGRYEVPLLLRDATFDSSGNLSFSSKSSGFFGKTPLVNGTLDPVLEVDRAVYRLRILNGCNARVLRLALSSGEAMVLIGNDGGLLRGPAISVPEITVSPGERLDVLVDLRSLEAGRTVMLRCLSTGWDFLQFAGTGAAAGPGEGTIPEGQLSWTPPLADPVVTRHFSFDGMTRINGRVYDMERIDFQVPFGQTERWVFRTNGNGPHPVHVHGAYFQVESRSGGRGRRFPWERGWKDTVLVNDKETVEVLIRFTAHRGLYVIHCHQLAHEDNGMMANFEVV
jgi:blue copper oxidase